MMKKKVLYIFAGIVVVLGGLLFGGQTWLKGRFQREALIQQIESEWNCRAELDASTVNLFASPARVELKGLRFAPRDAEIGKAIAQRAPLDPKAVEASIDYSELSVELWDLIHGKVNIKKLRFDGLGLRGEVDEEGKNSLDRLFSSPDKTPRVVEIGPDKKQQTVAVTAGDAHVSGVKVEPQEEKQPKEDYKASPEEKNDKHAPKESKEKKEKKAPEPFKAGNMPVSLQVDEAGIHDGRVEITDHGHGTHTLLDRLRFEIKGVDVNPTDLAQHNTCQLDFSATLKLEDQKSAVPTANIEFNGSGVMKPFDLESAELNPDLSLDLVLRKGSQLGGTLIKDNLRKKDAAKLKEYGIDLGDIALGGVLGEDVVTEGHLLPSGKLVIKKDTRLVFPQYEITVLEKSWFDSRHDNHSIHCKLVVSADLSAQLLEQAKKKIAESFGNDLASLAEPLLKKALFNEKSQLELPIRSSGSLSKPDINLDNALGNLKDQLKGAGTDMLKGLLGN